MSQIALLFTGIFIYTFGVHFSAQYRQNQLYLGSMLGVSALIWALFSNFYLFLFMVVLFLPFKRIGAYLVYLIFKRTHPKATNLNFKAFLQRQTFRENWKSAPTRDEVLVFCDLIYNTTGIREILKKHNESKDSLFNIYDEVIINYGGPFVARVIIATPYFLNSYLEHRNTPGHFKTPSKPDPKLLFKTILDVDMKEKEFLFSLSESFGFPDVY